ALPPTPGATPLACGTGPQARAAAAASQENEPGVRCHWAISPYSPAVNSRAASAGSVPSGHSSALTPAAISCFSCWWVGVSEAWTAAAMVGSCAASARASMSTRQVCGSAVTCAAMAAAMVWRTCRGDPRSVSGSAAIAASTRCMAPQSHSSCIARNKASLLAKYRYGVPLDTPACAATSAIVVVWYPARAKQASPAAMICSRRAARACSAILGTPPVPGPGHVRSGEKGPAAASGDSMPLADGRAAPGCQQPGDPGWRAQNKQRAQQAPVQPVGHPSHHHMPGGVRRTWQVGGEPGQFLPGAPGIRGPHPLAVFVRRQPALREGLIQHTGG